MVNNTEELLPCGHPKSSLYEGKYTVEGGECVDCGNEYVQELLKNSDDQDRTK